MPATIRELGLVNRNAADVFKELKRKATERGFSMGEFRDAMRIAGREKITGAPLVWADLEG